VMCGRGYIEGRFVTSRPDGYVFQQREEIENGIATSARSEEEESDSLSSCVERRGGWMRRQEREIDGPADFGLHSLWADEPAEWLVCRIAARVPTVPCCVFFPLLLPSNFLVLLCGVQDNQAQEENERVPYDGCVG